MKLSSQYAAGYIDGDGSIWAGRCGSKGSYRAFIAAAGSDEKLVDSFRETFGGYIQKTVDKRNPSWKPMFQWQQLVNRSGNALAEISPFLLLKQKQAELALRLIHSGEEIARIHLGRYGSVGLPAAEMNKREALRTEISDLNANSCNCPHVGDPSMEYFSGFFDAEGCVGVYTYERKTKPKAHRIHVNVSNRCLWILEKFKERFGGNVGKGHGGYQWQCTYRIAQRFLVEIIPFLILKKERAEVSLSLYDHCGSLGGWDIRGSQRNTDLVAAVRERTMQMNRKGIVQGY